MSKTTIKLLHGVAMLTMLLAGIGCTMTQPFPNAARPGDTITLGVGEADGMTTANTTVSFIPDANPSSPIDLTSNIRAVFNLFADKRSQIYNPANNVSSLTAGSGHEPWESVVILDLPATIPVGAGTMNVNTTGSFPAGGYGLIPNVTQVPISFNVLPGVGSSNPFNYSWGQAGSLVTNASSLSQFQPMKHYEVRPTLPINGFGKTYGAISMTFTNTLVLAPDQGIVLNGNILRVVPQDIPNTISQLQCSWTADATQITVNLLSASSNGMALAESRISLVQRPEIATFSSPPVMTSVHYYDINGNEVTGPTIDKFSISNN